MFSSSSNDPDGPAKCPYCSKDIGVENNTYRFQVVDFTAETGNNQRSAGRVIAVSCSNCKSSRPLKKVRWLFLEGNEQRRNRTYPTAPGYSHFLKLHPKQI